MFILISLTILLSLYTSIGDAGQVGGYHYEKPSVTFGQRSSANGHSFGPLPTISPLPPVPALPPLPTGRPNGQQIKTTSIYQTHPVAINGLQNTYQQPIQIGIGRIAQQYQTSRVQSGPSGPGPATAPASFSFPSGVASPASAPAQPLRIPFGKQAVISYPTTASGGQGNYQANGRQLKQYAVIEIIDNDIEQNAQPFLTTPFFDSYRAHIGASGTGAAPLPVGGGQQIQSRSSALLLEQQRRGASSSSSSAGNAVALGSGGLGFIRLANGNVYLGSGSLGYISGQQHTQMVNEARSRTGAPQPDAVHFGHGSLDAQKSNRFLYRFK